MSFQLGSSSDQSLKEGDELLNMSIYWNTGIGAIIFGIGFVVTTLLLAGVSLIAW
ncbi:putative NADH-Ubiquinone/plastoquinone [Prochlorococcus sp. MIT 0702]|nr:putative NADH-Ubiquinone/plastoquinone [Prochlorococcus sp. MIT 0701]KGG29710.1 putative NADH-Ubiquinone/plastoquinone [Prochlorococcus sp. MIT 0702]KGG34264.1 putative NADH-Ubiquinone/plastoquinone [Prochlorococcus sp. MIT 0703]